MKTKIDFITKQLSRAQHKRFENYVVTGIWHKLNDTDLKFVTQQYVARPEGRALTDMYFPQLRVHIEVDEGFHQLQINADKIREADIVNATGHDVLRVPITSEKDGIITQLPIEKINARIDEIVYFLQERKESIKPKPWDIEAEFNSQTWVDRGVISIDDDCSFLTMVDGANCFGLNYKPKAIWNGGATHPIEKDTHIWFPKLYPNPDYVNVISDDENTIYENRGDKERHDGYVSWILKSGRNKRIVFPRVKGPLGDMMYRFKGLYELDTEMTSFENGVIWNRIATSVRTYKYNKS
jgi:very-short-patch-repair endonuclease